MSVPLIVLLVLAALALVVGGRTIVARRSALSPGPSHPELEAAPDAERQETVAAPTPGEAPGRTTDAQSYRRGLAKTRGGFVDRLTRILRGKPKVDADLRDQIEEVLFTADIGTATAQKLFDRVSEVLGRSEVADPDAVWSVIRATARELVDLPAPPPAPHDPPDVTLAIGVNGVGKTTTLGKLAAAEIARGRRVLLVAGDTFRAAAVEQLGVWAERVGCDLHHGRPKADPSSVVFEGIARARREGHDVVLCDTAGRLHTKKELMDELAKVGRSTAKALSHAHYDTYLVLDATIGQNALAQAQLFKEAMEFTGLVITKLDGTAKGGVVLGICDEMKIPIRYLGVGEGLTDLRPFRAEEFVDALFADADPPGERP